VRSGTGKEACEFVCQGFVLSKEISDPATTHADVAGRHVSIGANVAEQFGHERLAEAHHFCVRFSFRIEVRAALATAHRQTRKRAFKNLFEGEELNDAGATRWMK